MPNFKNSHYFNEITADSFDAIHPPGTPTPFSGIYRCESCG
jgi:hypothetical protein